MIEKEKRKKRKEKQGCTEGLYIYYGKWGTEIFFHWVFPRNEGDGSRQFEYFAGERSEAFGINYEILV